LAHVAKGGKKSQKSETVQYPKVPRQERHGSRRPSEAIEAEKSQSEKQALAQGGGGGGYAISRRDWGRRELRLGGK